MKMRNKIIKTNNTEELLLLTKASRKSKEWLLIHPEYRNFWVFLKYRFYLKKLKKGTPIAYILKHKEFFGLDFLVNKHTLIPRPDTEIIVDEAIKTISDVRHLISNLLFIDIGTGVGCIPITVVQKLKDLKITTVATDISKKALKVAKKNAKKHKVNVKFLHGNLLSPIFQSYNLSTFKSIIITANLPYLKEEWWRSESTIQQEPKSALVSDNKTGLDLYERLLHQISDNLLIFKSCNLVIFLEIDPRQSSQIFILIQKYLPEADINIVKDLNNFDRVVKIKIF